MRFLTKFAKKGSYFQSKTNKIDTTIEFCIFELVFVSNFTLNNQFWIFGPNSPKKDIYGQKQKTWTSLFPLIQISLGTKFQLKLTILIFWPDLPKKGFSGLKQKKWTPHIFYIILHIQISLVRNWIKFAQKGISGQKLKKLTSSLNSAYSN